MKKRVLAVLLVITMSMGMMPEVNYAKSTSTESTEVASESTEDVTETTGNSVEEQMETESPEETEVPVMGQSVSGNVSGEDASYTYGTGFVQPQGQQVQITNQEACGAVDSTGARSVSVYDKYASNYYYNFLTGDERDFYDRLDSLSYTYLTSQKDISGATYNGKIYSDYVYGGSLTSDEMSEVLMLFKYSNPQYYFINSSYLYSYYGSDCYMAFGLYSAFLNGSTRSAATLSLIGNVSSMVSEIQAQTGVLAREKKAHDLIIDRVSYDLNIIELGSDSAAFAVYEDTAYTQSCYSTFCGTAKTTVCAGYALAFEMLCNAVGIDCIAVLSDSHAWNIARLNGNWYYVDCTWDDPVTSDGSNVKQYLYFNRNDLELQNLDQDSAHEAVDYMYQYIPVCFEDSGATADEVGTIAEAEGTSEVPVISMSLNGTGAVLTMSNAQDSEAIYYTLDGTTPSVSATKSYFYSGPITVNQSATVKAIGVTAGYYDSSIASQTVSVYQVSFNAQGGTAVATQGKTTGAAVTKPTNPTRTGYTFGGWYKEASCKTAWNFTTDKVTSNVTLYAKWTPVTYKITYTLNSGKQSKSNPATYTVAAATITLVSPTRKNYTFGGWYKDSKFKTKVTKISKGSTGNLNLYAKWTKVSVSKSKISSVKNQSGKKMAVAVKKISGAAGYQIRYSTNSKLKSAKTVVTKTTSATIKSLKKNKTYYVQVRAYKLDSAGNKIYGSWSGTSSVKIKK